MIPNNKMTHTVLLRAAELRAMGASWESVAVAIDRSIETVRKWPRIYRKRWKRLMEEAERQYILQASAEAVSALRQQVRSVNEKLACDAAIRLVLLRMALERAKRQRQRPAKAVASVRINTDGQRIAHHLRTFTDAQIDTILEELNGTARARRDSSDGDSDLPSTT